MKAVHFGAGNIGRGFVGLLLHEGGYDMVFSDVSESLVDALNAADSYTVHELGPGGVDHEMTNFRAVNSKTDPEALAREIATADVVTTAVGPTILPFIAANVLDGIRERSDDAAPLAVMACENAIGATDTLRDAVVERAGEEWSGLAHRAVFANTAVDRIVPVQPPGEGINVVVEPFLEWAIEKQPFHGDLPHIPGAHFVDDLAPYIERKLFTVNTGHAATAYFGARAGAQTIAESLAIPEVWNAVDRALKETSALLVKVYGMSAENMAEYREAILSRFQNPELPDTVWRVGRQPIRKLGRHERFVGPAAAAADHGLETSALVQAIGAALDFVDPDDAQAVELQALLSGNEDVDTIVERITGLVPADKLYAPVHDVFAARAAALRG